MNRFTKGLVASALVIGLSAGTAGAGVQISQVVLSPQILLDIYRAVQNNQSSIAWNNPAIIQIAALADAASAGHNLAFTVAIFDGPTWVARAGRFQALSHALVLGPNLFNANDIGGSGLTLSFNSSYKPNTSGLASNGLMPTGNFRVIFTPVDAGTGTPVGPDYVLQLALFTPSSALNQPPIPIYPVGGVAVNSPLPVFSWTTVPNAASYVVQVGPNQDTNVNTYWQSGRILPTQVLYAPEARALVNGQQYFWQVKALDALGNPIGGVDGRSQAADFTINSSARVTTAVAPGDVETVLRAVIKDPNLFPKLNGYQAVAIETTADDLAGLLLQLRDGTATVTEAGVE